MLKQAIEKYGRNKFTKTILHISRTKAAAFKTERRLIREAQERNDGCYNLAEGGEGHKGPNKASRGVLVFSSELTKIKQFSTMVEAARFLTCYPSTIKEACEYALIGKSSCVRNHYVCYVGGKPHKKDFSYLVKRNKTVLAKHNKGKKRPEHGLLVSKLNQRRPAAMKVFTFTHVTGITFTGTRTELRIKFPQHDINRSELTAMVRGRYRTHRGWSIKS